MSEKKKKKAKPIAYQAVIIENYDDGTFDVRMEAGRLTDGKYVPEIRQRGGDARCGAQDAARLTGEAAARFQRALLASVTGGAA